MKHFWKYDLVPILSVVTVCVFPSFFMYCRNILEAPVGSMVPFIIIFLLNAAVIFGLVSPFLRNVSRSAVVTVAAMLVIINFCLVAGKLKEWMPFFRDRYLLLICGLLLLGLFLLLLRKKPDLRVACLLILIAFGSMMVMNFVIVVPELIQHKPWAVEEAPEAETKILFGENQPNVYYFVFDEYGGYQNLLYYYDYDNSEFLEALEERGFSVARDSRNTEAVETVTLLPNLLNMDYVVSIYESSLEKQSWMHNFRMGQMFRDNGYQVNLVNHVDFIGTEGCQVLTSDQTRRTISEYVLRNSIYNKFEALREFFSRFFPLNYSTYYRQGLDNALEMALSSPDLAEGKTLTVGYIQCPHSPTMVGPNGEALPFETGWSWWDHSLYLGQLSFVSDYILDLVDTIQEKDPEAMIILQSDHGNRYPIHMYQIGVLERYDAYEEDPRMQNILNCVYYKGNSYPIEGETGINTLRMMFREVLGADLPPITPVYTYFFGYEDETQ